MLNMSTINFETFSVFFLTKYICYFIYLYIPSFYSMYIEYMNVIIIQLYMFLV